jgi:hypothetical protein
MVYWSKKYLLFVCFVQKQLTGLVLTPATPRFASKATLASSCMLSGEWEQGLLLAGKEQER